MRVTSILFSCHWLFGCIQLAFTESSVIHSLDFDSSICQNELELSRKNNSNVLIFMKAAVCLHQGNQVSNALQIYNHVQKVAPDYSFVLVNIALVALKDGNPAKVIRILENYFNQVGGIQEGGEDETLKLSSTSDRDALRIGPPCRSDAKYKADCVHALNIYASALMEQYNTSSAQYFFQKAIDIGGNITSLKDVYCNYAALLSNVGDFEGAADLFLKGFWISVQTRNLDPSPLIRRALIVPSVSSSLEESISFQRQFELKLRDIISLIEFGGEGWKDDSSDLFRLTAGTSQAKDIFSLPPLKHTPLSDLANRIQTPHFHFQYYGFHDKPTAELVAFLFQQICPQSDLFQVASTIAEYTYPSLVSLEAAPLISSNIIHSNQRDAHRSDKIRIAFVSSHFGGNEPHGLLVIDVIRRLPRSKFECFAIGIGKKKPSKEFLSAVSENYYHVGHNEAQARDILSSLRLDCLVFGEILNEAILYFLSFQRFAPVQILVMGAPISSGIPSIDYFISGDRLEYPFRTHLSGNRSHEEPYSEQVVLFDGQSISFPRFDHLSHDQQDSRLAAGDAISTLPAHISSSKVLPQDKFGIPLLKDAAVYLCYQSLFKIHPIFDDVIMKILNSDRKGHVVLQASRVEAKTQIVLNRIRKYISRELCRGKHQPCPTAQDILSRIHFIPRVTSDQVINVFKRGTVVLHPFPFGGSKTAVDALDAGAPLVTFPQKYLKGRLAASFYITMALHEVNPDITANSCCVASDVSDYIAKALHLGIDENYRRKVIQAIAVRKDRIFNDLQTSFEWARFLCRAMGVIIDSNDLMLEMEYFPLNEEKQEFELIMEQYRWKRSSKIEKHLEKFV